MLGAGGVGDLVDEVVEEPDDHGPLVIAELTGRGVDGFEVGLEFVLADLPSLLGECDDDPSQTQRGRGRAPAWAGPR